MRCPKIVLLFICFASWCFFPIEAASVNDAGEPVALYLSWQRSPESTMTIRWITSMDQTDSVIDYRRESDPAWAKSAGGVINLPEKQPYLLHSLELTNLIPGTTYLFRIGCEGKTYKFQTMPADLRSPIRFVSGGDMYHDEISILRETNKQAAKTSPLFVLVGGDIAYASTKVVSFLPRWTHPYMDHLVGQKIDRWLTWLKAWKEDMVTPDGRLIPMVPAIGNHDTSGRFGQTPAEAPYFYSLFAFPGNQGYNVLDFGNYMSLIILDSGHTHTVGGQQATWLASILGERKGVPHKFALYHVPAYPSVHSLSEEIGTDIRKYWVPSFDAYQLTAAFENHEHAYKRTHLLKNGAIDPSGVLYIGDGGWGVKKTRKPRHLNKKTYLARAASTRHFIVVDVQQESRTATAVDSTGDIIDTFTW